VVPNKNKGVTSVKKLLKNRN